MICTGTLILNAKAQLFSILMLKNRNAVQAHFAIGTLGGLKPRLGNSVSWKKLEMREVKANWRKVIRRPKMNIVR
jgi:hypothetical protein